MDGGAVNVTLVPFQITVCILTIMESTMDVCAGTRLVSVTVEAGFAVVCAGSVKVSISVDVKLKSVTLIEIAVCGGKV